MILRQINKPGLDSWHSQRFPTPKSLDPYLGPLIQGLQGSFLDSHVAWALGCRHIFRLLPMLRVSGAMPPFRQHFVMAWMEQVYNKLNDGYYTARRSGLSVGGEGNRMCLYFTCQLLIHCKSTRHHADGSERASNVTNCSCARCRYFILQLHSSLHTATPQSLQAVSFV